MAIFKHFLLLIWVDTINAYLKKTKHKVFFSKEIYMKYTVKMAWHLEFTPTKTNQLKSSDGGACL